jgi:hypothetical protein
VSQATWNANGTTPLPGGFSVPFGGGMVLPSQLGIGTHYYVCQAHVSFGMKGKIIVTGSSVQKEFQMEYGTPDSQSDASGASIRQTTDGGYIMTGYNSNFGDGGDDIYLVKTDADGNMQWNRTFGGTEADDANALVQTSDGGFAIAGVTLSFGGEKAFLIKTDGSGNISWSKVYGTADNLSDASVSSMQQTSDGGFIMTGYISNFGAGMDDFYLVKTDMNGVILWTKTYGGTNNDDAASVAQTSDGGYIITGMTSSFADPNGDVYLVKTNASGDTLWTKTYGDVESGSMDMGNYVGQTADGGYIIAGVTSSTSSGEFGLLIKTDNNGVMQWSKLYGIDESSSDVSFASGQQTSDGGYVAAGYTSNYGAGSDDYLLVKIDASGEPQWTSAFGSSENDDANSVMQTSDGGYVMAGSTLGFATGGEHLYVVKADTNGHAMCNEFRTEINTGVGSPVNSGMASGHVSSGGVAATATLLVDGGGVVTQLCFPAGIHESSDNNFTVSVSPNPSSSKFIFTLSKETTNAELKIYDVTGNIVRVVDFQGTKLVLDRTDLASGIYFYVIRSGSTILGKGKIVVE